MDRQVKNRKDWEENDASLTIIKVTRQLKYLDSGRGIHLQYRGVSAQIIASDLAANM